MARPPQTRIDFRLIVRDPVAGVTYSLQDKKSHPVNPQVSDGSPLAFEFSARVSDSRKLFGDQIRTEGAERRFVYIATGQQAGDAGSCWSRRMKIDLHTIPPAALAQALKGGVLEAEVRGAGPDGTPACATVLPISPWLASR